MGDVIEEYLPMYLSGSLAGIGLTVLVMVVALVIALMIALARVSPRVLPQAVGTLYVGLFRATPPLVLLFLVYFGLPSWAMQSDSALLKAIIEPVNNRIVAVVVALSMVVGAYSAEIIRAAIQSIDVEQMEAGRSIGMSRMLCMRRIILPQALRTAVPSLANEFIVTLKGTSITSVIGVTEVTRAAQIAAGSTFHTLEAYALAACFYLVMVAVLQAIVALVERRLGHQPPSRSAGGQG